MNYEKEILHVLCAAGNDGLSIRKISLHVHSACSTLFEPLDINVVHNEVASWLLRNSRGTSPLVCRIGKRGVYAINYSSPVARQIMFDFSDDNFLVAPFDVESVGEDNCGQRELLLF